MPDHSHPPIISLRLEAERRRNLLAERLSTFHGTVALGAAVSLAVATIVAWATLSGIDAGYAMMARV